MHCNTFTELPDSSKLERKPWERNGFNFSGPFISTAQASHSSDGTSEIDETTESETFLGNNESTSALCQQ